MFRLVHGPRCAGLAAVLLTLPAAAATLTVPASGTSAAGNPVSFMATLTVSGSTLDITLENTSLVPTSATDDVLSSFYFDILQDGVRPTSLALTAAAGQVYQVRRKDADVYVPGGLPDGSTNLVAAAKGAGTWQFRTMNPGLTPGFGIGTVGNSVYSPNNFDPLVVNQADYTIYSTGTRSDIDPVGNLVGRLLVRGSASFQFTGLDPQRPVEIVDKFVFGLGTSPDSVIVAMPEPSAAALVVPGLLAALLAVGGKRGGRPFSTWRVAGLVRGLRARLIRFRRRAAAPRPRPAAGPAS